MSDCLITNDFFPIIFNLLDNNSFGYDMGWWKEEHFNASDADGDGLLNLTEFNEWGFHYSSSLIYNDKFFPQGKRGEKSFLVAILLMEDNCLCDLWCCSFLHPADTKNPKLILWLSKEEVRWHRFLKILFSVVCSYLCNKIYYLHSASWWVTCIMVLGIRKIWTRFLASLSSYHFEIKA